MFFSNGRCLMSERRLDGLKVAILVSDGFEQSELTGPREALDAAGAETEVISPRAGHLRGWNSKDWVDEVTLDRKPTDAKPENYDALVLPGGAISVDALMLQPKAVAFVKAFFSAGKPVAVICHAARSLESGNARDGRLTSWPSLKTDLSKAGAQWIDEE
jgi:deglycase